MKKLILLLFLIISAPAFSQSDPMYPTEQQLKKQVINSDPITQSTFHQFVDRRAGGKVLQIIGALGLTYSVFHILKEQERVREAVEKNDLANFEEKKLSSIIPALSGGIFSIGVIMDISAGSDLKK